MLFLQDERLDVLPNGSHLTFGSYGEESRPLKRTLKQVSFLLPAVPYKSMRVLLSNILPCFSGLMSMDRLHIPMLLDPTVPCHSLVNVTGCRV